MKIKQSIEKILLLLLFEILNCCKLISSDPIARNPSRPPPPSIPLHINNYHLVLLLYLIILLIWFLHYLYVVLEAAFYLLKHNLGPIIDFCEPVVERVLNQALGFLFDKGSEFIQIAHGVDVVLELRVESKNGPFR